MGILGSEAYKAITLGVQTVGQPAVDALERAMQDAKTQLQAFQQQMRAGGPVTAQQVRELGELAAAYDRAAEAASAGQRVFAGKAADATTNVRGLAGAIQELGRGIQDVSIGSLAGGINNLSPMVMSLGSALKLTTPQVQALGAATDIVSSLAYAFYMNWDRVRALTDDGLGPRLLPDVKALSKELDELKDKKLPTLIEQNDIANLERTVDRLGKIEAALKAMKASTTDQQKAGKIVTTGVVEAGGLEAVVKSYLDATAGAETPEDAATRKKIADLLTKENAAAASGNEDAAALYARSRQDLEKTDAGRRAADRANRDTAARRLVGAAGIGDEASRAELAGVYDRSRPVFERNGVSFRFRQALEDASPLKLHAEEQAKIATESEKLFKDAMAKDVREAVQRVRKGLDDAAADGIQSALQAGTPLGDASKAARDAILPALKQRGIGKSIVGAVADEIVKDAADEAQNRIGEGERSRLQARRDQAKARADTAVEQEINRLTTSARGGYQDEAERTIYEGLKAGKDADALQRGEMPALTKALRDRGNVPEKLVNDVAAKILAQATDKALNDLDSGVAPKLVRQEQTAKDAAARKQDAADKKQIGDLGGAYLQYAETLLARNRLAARNGVPIARSDAEIARYERSGADYALPEGEARRRVGLDLAAGLKNTGQNPALAAPMMRQAVDKLGDSVSKSMAAGANETQALIAVMHDLADQFGQLQGRVAQSAGVNGAAVEGLKKKVANLRGRTSQLQNLGRRLGNQSQSFNPY